MSSRLFPYLAHMWKLCALGIVILACHDARADLLQDCNGIASQINRSTPQQLDRVTKLLSSTCVPDGRVVRLIYMNEISVPNGSVNQGTLDSMRPRMVQAWCTDPDQRTLINLIDIQYSYSYSDGRLIGKINLSGRDCS
jgi:hypothetical protein